VLAYTLKTFHAANRLGAADNSQERCFLEPNSALIGRCFHTWSRSAPDNESSTTVALREEAWQATNPRSLSSPISAMP